MSPVRLLAAAAVLAAPALAAPEAGNGFAEVEVLEVVATGQGFAVLLLDRDREMVLPIFIGPAEGLAIELRLRKQQPPRPLTHDLLEDVIEALGAKLVRVEVSDLKSDTFFGRLVLDQKGKSVTLDARPSDSIAVALGAGAPIHVARKVLERAGLSLKDFREKGGKAIDEARPKVESL